MNSTALDPHFVLRKLHSLLGIIPVGVFLIFHLFENSLATKGAEYYTEHVVYKISNLPYVEFMEIFFIGLPILFHGIYGVVIWFQGRSNVTRYRYLRNWMYWIQRVAGGIALIFIITHVWGTRFTVILDESVGRADLFDHLASTLKNPWMLSWYIVGILSSVIHFANGIWLSLITWGFTIGRRSQRISSWVCVFIALVLLVLSAQALRGLLFAGAR